jgi:aminoglycoside phosphotransferase
MRFWGILILFFFFALSLSLSLSPEKKRLLREFGSCREWRHVTMSPSVDTYYVVVTLKDIFFILKKSHVLGASCLVSKVADRSMSRTETAIN